MKAKFFCRTHTDKPMDYDSKKDRWSCPHCGSSLSFTKLCA